MFLYVKFQINWIFATFFLSSVFKDTGHMHLLQHSKIAGPF